MRARQACNRCNTGHPRAWSIARFPIRTPSRAREPLSKPTRRTSTRIIDLGVAQSGARQFREAIATFTQGLEIEPNNALLLRWRGHRYLSVREFDRAFADLTRGGTIDSEIYGISTTSAMPASSTTIPASAGSSPSQPTAFEGTPAAPPARRRQHESAIDDEPVG